METRANGPKRARIDPPCEPPPSPTWAAPTPADRLFPCKIEAELALLTSAYPPMEASPPSDRLRARSDAESPSVADALGRLDSSGRVDRPVDRQYSDTECCATSDGSTAPTWASRAPSGGSSTRSAALTLVDAQLEPFDSGSKPRASSTPASKTRRELKRSESMEGDRGHWLVYQDKTDDDCGMSDVEHEDGEGAGSDVFGPQRCEKGHTSGVHSVSGHVSPSRWGS